MVDITFINLSILHLLQPHRRNENIFLSNQPYIDLHNKTRVIFNHVPT